jgi:two-component system, NarL family, nitrate/nitrite response regulator NarL
MASLQMAEETGVRILLADDHELVCDGFKAVIERHAPESEVVTAHNFDEAFSQVLANGCYDVTLLDLNMPGMQGLDGLKRMVAHCPTSAVAIITGMVTKSVATSALAAGAKGFIPKTLSAAKLISALRLLAEGEVYAPADLIRPSGSTEGLKIIGAEVLTPRELEVAAMLVKGASNKEIARSLDLQEVTVKLHVRNLGRKLETKNRTQIAVRLAQLGQFT